jgi:acyl-CoA-binding protein
VQGFFSQHRHMSVELRFKKATFLVRNGPPRPDASNEEKLKFYSFYKQATEGDVQGSQPWAVQLEARSKWDAWSVLEAISFM